MGSTAQRTLVVAPPPTPNGGLHLGHLGGPYLAADVAARELRSRGVDVFSAISTDDFQSYVDVRARALGCSRETLVDRSREDIRTTIDRYALGFGPLGEADETYRAFVATFFEAALAAGHCEIAEVTVACDEVSGSPLHGPQLTGFCGRCLAPACEGICESCGEPNSGHDMLEARGSGGVVLRAEPRLVVDLERYRDGLTDWLNTCEIRCPKLIDNIARWLARPLGHQAISRAGNARGVAAPAALAGQTIDPWAEMYPGHFHHLERKAGTIRPDDRYLQFLGFDNGYFYTILHGALAIVGRNCGYDWPRPAALVINRFYNLGNSKFSTSQGHAIWANDFATRINSDLIRFYLALYGPQFDEATFVEDLAMASIEEIAALINRIADAYNRRAVDHESIRTAGSAAVAPPPPPPPASGDALSMKALSGQVLSRLRYIDAMIAAGREDAVLATVPDLFAARLAPLMPRFALQVEKERPRKIPAISSAPITGPN